MARVVAGLAVGLAIGLSPVAAQAAPVAAGSPYDCPDYAVCFWTEYGFEGQMTVKRNPGDNCDPAPNGRIRSIVNNIDRPVWLFDDRGCRDEIGGVGPGDMQDWVRPDARGWI